MNNSTITRLASVATIVAAALSLAGVASGGGLRPDDRAGLRPVAAAPAIASDIVRPDDRAGFRGADHGVLATISAQRRSEGSTREPSAVATRSALTEVGAWAVPAANSENAVTQPGTDALDEGGAWTATAALSAAGLLVLVLGAAVVVRRNHRGAQSNA
jgi:hypothetical protein